MAQNDLLVRLNLDASDFTENIEKTKKSISELGQKATDELVDIASRFKKTSDSSTPWSRKIRDIRKQMQDLTAQGARSTKEGEALYQKLAAKAREYDLMLKQIQGDTHAETQAIAEESQASQTLSQKVSEIKAQMEELITTGRIATEEGKKMWVDLADEAARYNDAIKQVNTAAREGGTKPEFDLGAAGDTIANAAGLGNVSKIAGALAGAVNPATIAVGAVGTAMVMAGKSAAEFETHLNSLQALTGLTDEGMKSISDGAIQLSKQFKSTAGEIVDSMKLIGSQAPALLSDADALMEVTKAANVLSEAAEIDVTTAASAITTVMNQMGESSAEVENIINTFAAASQKGSADVSNLITVFEKSGTAATMAGLNYTELTAAIEAAKGKFGDAANEGTSLQNMFLQLEKQTNDNFKPSVVGLSQALENLAAQSLTTEEKVKLFGQSGLIAAKALIENRDEFNRLSQEISGTNTAYEQMEINQKGFAGAMTKAKSAWEAFLLVLGQSGIIDGIMDNIAALLKFIGDLCNAVGDIIKAFDLFNVSAEDCVPTMFDFKKQLEMIITVVNYVGDAIEIVIAIIAKVVNYIQEFISWIRNCMTNVTDSTNTMGQAWSNFIKILTDNKFVQKILGYFRQITKWFTDMVNGFKKQWNDFIGWLGLGDDKKFGTAKVEKKAVTTKQTNTVNDTETNSTTTATETKSSKSKSSKTEKIDYLVYVDDNTLETAEKKLSAWQNKLKTIKIDDIEGLQECNAQIKKWQDEVEKRKLVITVGTQIFDNLNMLKERLSDLENLKSVCVSIDFDDEAAQNELIEFMAEVNSLNGREVNVDLKISGDTLKIDEIDRQIRDLQSDILIESIKIGFKPEIEKGSKTEIENEIKKLEEARKILFSTQADPATVKKVDDEIKSLKKNLEAEEIRLGIKPKVDDGSINAIQKKIKEKEEEISLALNTDIDPESMKKLQSELDSLRKHEREKSIEIGVTKNVATISKKSESWERGSVEDKKQSMSNAQSMVKEIQENYRLKLIGKDEVKSELADINSKLEELNLKPIELTFNDDGTLTTAAEDLERYKNQMSAVSDMAGNMGSVFGSLGSAIGGTTGEVMNFAGQSINAIAQIIPQIVSMIAAKEAEAIAGGTASAASMPFPANIAAIAGIVATIAGIFASLPKFESGGIVGGTSFTGDKLLARVNSGEMILNKTQQKNLYNSMSAAEVGTPMQNTLKGDVNFTISGSALKGTLKNYDAKMSKIK